MILFNSKIVFSRRLQPKSIIIGSRFFHNEKYINVYNELKYFLENRPLNNETQIKIENFLLNNGIKESKPEEIGGLFNGLYSQKTTKFLVKYKPFISKKINNFSQFAAQELENKEVSTKARSILYLADIIKVVKEPYILTVLLGRFVKILSNSRHNYTYEKNLVLDTALDLSKDLIRKYLSLKYKNELNVRKNEGKTGVYTFSDWKSDNSSLTSDLDNSSIRVNIGAILIEWLEDCNLITKQLVKLRSKQHSYIHSTDQIIRDLEDTMNNEMWTSSELSNPLLQSRNMILPASFRLPMIVKPKPYSLVENKLLLGGYLLNDVEYSDPLILQNHTQDKQSIIHKENLLYDTINKLNSVGYKINNEMMDFINLKPELYKTELLTETHELEKKKTKLKYGERMELQRYTSKKELQEHILSIADLFANIPEFFFINRIDNRGRTYCVCEYLNFQGSDLAKSLLLFSKPNKISRFEDKISVLYLKVYGANCFGNKIDKLSINKKEEWVNEHSDRIINYENGEIIQEAENKLLFTAFCIEYKKWWNFKYNSTEIYFNTFLPIQLDASCNGFQHLVLLSGEENLRKELNLTESDFSKNPYDFYSYVLEIYKDYLNDLDFNSFDEKKKFSYRRIQTFTLNRKIVKKVIMTIPYNVGTKNMVKYVKDTLIKKIEKKGDEEFIWFEDNSGNENILTYKDLNLLVTSIKDVLDKTAPRIAKLKTYLKKIANICSELEIHIPWLLPVGLEVRQSYLEKASVPLKPFTYSNSKVSLATYTKKIDLNRQKRAFMPNLIHSLDATSLMLLTQKYFNNNEFDIKNIYTIHDCFAIPMNHVEFIIDNLRKVYITLYSDSCYLELLDKGILNNIEYHYGNIKLDRHTNTLTIKNLDKELTFDYPDIKEVLGRELPKIGEPTPYLLI